MKVLSLLCADLHLSEHPPVARSAEPDWLVAQARLLRQLADLADEHQCPILCAGDVWDRHNAGPAVINWASETIPNVYAIPGQHDLPMHNLDDLHKSAYMTLIRTGVVKTFDVRGEYDGWVLKDRLHVNGFPWGHTPGGLEGREDCPDAHELQLALIHSYIWIAGKSYPGAPDQGHLASWVDRLKGYDVAVFGDNHQHFTAKAGSCRVWNCGCLIRRKQDERNLRPTVGLLMEDGTIKAHELDCSEDKWIDEDDQPKPYEDVDRPGLAEFLGELRGLEAESPDFRDLVRRYAQRPEVPAGVKGLLLRTIGD